ncbi:GDSL-type esterase/lipase family protein [Oxalobacteraceae bacterium A2-2]
MKRSYPIPVIALLSACGMAAAAPASPDFVTVRDSHFSRQGRLYTVAGANLWYGGHLGASDPARLMTELDRLQSIGVNNLRVLAMSEATRMDSAVRPATMSAPGQYDERLLRGLDLLMAEAGRRGMTVVLYLNNFWQWSGGMTQYLNWAEGPPAIDPNVSRDYNGYMQKTAAFYRSAAAQAAYRKAIAMLAGRVNTVSGKRYADDPAILSWQLANEPRPGNGQATAGDKAVYVQWIADTAGYIHSLDGNHLVSSGSEGLAGSAQDAQLYLDAHRSAHIDYLTYHLWPKNWGWFDTGNPAATWDGAIAKSRDYLSRHIDLARQLGKPIVLEEFGLDRDGGAFSPKAGTTIRDRFYREVFDIVSSRAARGDPIAGFNFWAWGGAGRAAHADYWWKPGDDFLGDPPQEEQGLYSVFDSDAGTLALVKDYAGRLAALAGAGVPAAGVPAAGSPAAGVPAAGSPAAGSPAAGSPAAMPVAVAAGDSRVAVMGRTQILPDGALRFAYPGVSLFVNVEGTRLSMNAAGARGQNYVDVIVDGGAPRTFRIAAGMQAVPLLDGAAPGHHSVEIVNRTETRFGAVTVAGFNTDGKLVAPPALPQRKLAVLGDSVTCGEAAERQPHGKKEASWWNARLSYGMLVAKALQAQVQLVCYGGRGLVRTWDNKTDALNLEDYYQLAVAEKASPVPWDQSRYHPDLILVAIGTNDFAPGVPERERYVGAYVRLLRQLRADHPQARIALTEGSILEGAQKETLRGYIAEAIRRAGDGRIYAVDSSRQPGEGGDDHPTLAQHAAMAAELAPQLRRLMGW